MALECDGGAIAVQPELLLDLPGQKYSGEVDPTFDPDVGKVILFGKTVDDSKPIIPVKLDAWGEAEDNLPVRLRWYS